jgi:hypothetical protein
MNSKGVQTDLNPNIVVINRNAKLDKKKTFPPKKVGRPKGIAGAKPTPEQKMRIFQNVIKPKMERNVVVQGEDDMVSKIREAFGTKLTSNEEVNRIFDKSMLKVNTGQFPSEAAPVVKRGRGRPPGSGSGSVVISSSSSAGSKTPSKQLGSMIEKNLSQLTSRAQRVLPLVSSAEKEAVQALTQLKNSEYTRTPKGASKQREEYSRLQSGSDTDNLK